MGRRSDLHAQVYGRGESEGAARTNLIQTSQLDPGQSITASASQWNEKPSHRLDRHHETVSVPDFAADLHTTQIGQGLAAMDV
jgi:hypothetical protein